MADIVFQSKLFGSTLRTAPREAEAINHRLLAQGGFVSQLMAGVYVYLPLGLRVLTRIAQIVREEMIAIGAQELLMPALHPKEPWAHTGRWNDPGREVMFQFTGRGDKAYGLGWTHEEIITPLAKQFIQSYKDLPLAVFQIQQKFRDEPRAKSGLLRGREFSMKDLYSFHRDEADLEAYYETVLASYNRIFRRLFLEARVVEASGGAFSPTSHEFQVVTASGEDSLVLCPQCQFAQNADLASIREGGACPRCGGKVKNARGIEVGNIFKLKTRFTEAFDVVFTDADGSKKPVFMGCYGIGLSRALGALVEVHHDDRGIIWPAPVAPFDVHVVLLPTGRSLSASVRTEGETIAEKISQADRAILIDDRAEQSAGEKFADADLLGIPWRIVLNEQHQRAGTVGVKHRRVAREQTVPCDNLESYLREQGTEGFSDTLGPV